MAHSSIIRYSDIVPDTHLPKERWLLLWGQEKFMFLMETAKIHFFLVSTLFSVFLFIPVPL